MQEKYDPKEDPAVMSAAAGAGLGTVRGSCEIFNPAIATKMMAGGILESVAEREANHLRRKDLSISRHAASIGNEIACMSFMLAQAKGTWGISDEAIASILDAFCAFLGENLKTAREMIAAAPRGLAPGIAGTSEIRIENGRKFIRTENFKSKGERP